MYLHNLSALPEQQTATMHLALGSSFRIQNVAAQVILIATVRVCVQHLAMFIISSLLVSFAIIAKAATPFLRR